MTKVSSSFTKLSVFLMISIYLISTLNLYYMIKILEITFLNHGIHLPYFLCISIFPATSSLYPLILKDSIESILVKPISINFFTFTSNSSLEIGILPAFSTSASERKVVLISPSWKISMFWLKSMMHYIIVCGTLNLRSMSSPSRNSVELFSITVKEQVKCFPSI